MNDVFRFKKFSVLQYPEVFKVGTDSVLLGCMANLSSANSILDIGTGTGLLSLMCAQRNTNAIITAIESEREAFILAQKNISISEFFSRISVFNSELQNFLPSRPFDYIICNPPYFKSNHPLHFKHPVARQQVKLDYQTLIEKSKTLLNNRGIMGCIFPYCDESIIISHAKSVQLYPQKIIRISGIKNGKINRSFLELSDNNTTKTEESYFCVEKSPRVWSDEYKTLTSDFYL